MSLRQHVKLFQCVPWDATFAHCVIVSNNWQHLNSSLTAPIRQVSMLLITENQAIAISFDILCCSIACASTFYIWIGSHLYTLMCVGVLDSSHTSFESPILMCPMKMIWHQQTSFPWEMHPLAICQLNLLESFWNFVHNIIRVLCNWDILPTKMHGGIFLLWNKY